MTAVTRLDSLFDQLAGTRHAPNMLGFLRRVKGSVYYREGTPMNDATDDEVEKALASYVIEARVAASKRARR